MPKDEQEKKVGPGFIRDPEQKFNLMCERLERIEAPRGKYFEPSLKGLAQFAVHAEMILNGAESVRRYFKDVRGDFYKCRSAAKKSPDGIGNLSKENCTMLMRAFSVPADSTNWFRDGGFSEFEKRFAELPLPELPSPTVGMIGESSGPPTDLQLVALQPDYIWRPDNLSTDLSCNQGYDLQPSLEIDAMRFRIVGMDYAFVFKSLSAVISAPKGSAISFEKRAGLKSPVVASPYSLTGRGTAARAQFIIAPEKAGFIEGHAFFEDPLFTVMNAKEGDEITIEMRIKQCNGSLLAIESENKLTSQEESVIERLFARDGLKKAPKPAAPVEYEAVDQYITLVRQRLIVTRKETPFSSEDDNR